MTANAGSVIVKVGLDDREFNRGMSNMDKRLGGFSKLSSVAFKAGAVAAGGFGAAIIGAVKAAGNFEQSLNVFQSVSKASAAQMKAVSDKAKALGSDLSLPATSAKDAADAMLELSKGNLSVSQTMDAAKGVLQLSAAATIDNAQAATIVVRALKAFGLAGTDASRVADVLANAANASTGEITDFALGLQQSSAVAKMTGLTLNETTAALMQLADAGIIGSDAGTSLKTMLMSLNPETDKAKNLFRRLGIDVYDARGQFVGYRDTVGQVFDGLKQLNQEQRTAAMRTLFGSDAIRSANVNLMAGTKAFDSYLRKTEQSGTAAAVANAKMKGFNGAVQGLKSVVETLAIEIGSKALPALTELVNRFSKWIGNAENADRVTRAAAGAVDIVGSAARTVWPILQKMADALVAVKDAVGGWKTAFAIVTSGLLAGKLIGLAGAFGLGGGIAGQAALATGKVGGLKAALLGINGLTVTASIIIGTVLKNVQEKLDPGFNKRGAGWRDEQGNLHFGSPPAFAPPSGGTFGPNGFTGALSKLIPAMQNEVRKKAASILGSGVRASTVDTSAADAALKGRGSGDRDGGGGGGGGGGSSAADALAAARKASADRLQEMYQASIEARKLKQSEAADLLRTVGEYEANLTATQRKAAADRQMDAYQQSIDLRNLKQSEAATILRAVTEHEAEVKAAQVAAVKERLAAMLAVVDSKREAFTRSFAKIGDAGLRAFDAMTAAFRTPGESALASIRERRQQEDAAQAVTDAETRLAQVRADTDSTAADIASAERALARAREDITITSLEKTAQAERTDYEARRENLRTSLEDRLAQIKEHFSLEGGTVAGLTKQITDTLASYGVDFATVGGRLGSAFIEGLQAAITAAGQGSEAVKAAVAAAAGAAGTKTGGFVRKPGSFGHIAEFAHGGIVKATPGGTIARIGEAGRDEAVIPLPRDGGLGGGQTIVNITVQGSLIHERDLEDVVHRAAESWSRRNGPWLSRTAGATA